MHVVQQNFRDGLNTVPAMGRKGPIARPVTVGEEIQRFDILLTRLRANSERGVLSQPNDTLNLLL